ncbi:hypothetical protein [Burkholderia ubonensis]|uniref:hypothetical protein n=2 Tax=Burkholderia ubonensis TaxID=101571 RepID=UPI001E300F57|nr:hypothetical protein [Burkholderia ubonensis]
MRCPGSDVGSDPYRATEAQREMTNSIDNRDKDAKAQFDEAARRLEAAEARLQALFANPFADETARQTALESYQEARLLWLSSEAVLRSAAIVDDPPRHAGKSVVILRGNPHVGESIALLLRLRGFSTTVLPKHRVEETVAHGPVAAVIVDIERDPHRARELAVDTLRTYPGARIVGMVPQTLARCDWREFHAVIVKPASIDMIVRAIAGDAGAS